jgi:uncharacterized protein YyaL (SSP411 family)
MRRRRTVVILVAMALACGEGGVERGGPAASEAVPAPAAAIEEPLSNRNLLPGAPPFSAAFQRKLDAALAAKGDDYVPRTHHLRPDGSPKYTNRLILESSPYLLQHAHNPVNWYAWGEEAFERARRENRPVILSVGYSTCHWCHVMEKESFEDEEIARAMNELYVVIKVDREERPDVDEVYMTAVQLLAGRGGWPMTVWLTPAGKPFFAGTYFPPRDGVRGAPQGFLTLVRRLREVYDQRGSAVAEHADQIVAAIRAASRPSPSERSPGVRELHAAGASLQAAYDPANGGFGRAPKFPQPSYLEFLLRYHRRTRDPKLLEMVERTLERMAAGGMYDQMGGGFHRYATDAAWQVPHFEKMLYDNALLTVAYLEGYQATGRPEFARIAREILDYLLREMRSPEGGFYSATDADSEGTEGKFFLWTAAEIDRVLGARRGKFIRTYYGVKAQGNFEHANILHVASDLGQAARAAGIPPGEAEAALRESRRALYEARRKRVPPLTDTKIITAWNGLALSALARGAQVLDAPAYAVEARRSADFILSKLLSEGRLKRIWKDGRAKAEGTLTDYAFLAAGLLDLYEASADLRYLRAAKGLMETLDAHFGDPEGGGYFLTPEGGERLIARQKPESDGAVPSGNSVAAANLLRLAEFTSEDGYRERADALVRGVSGILARSPRAATKLRSVIDFRNDLPKEIVIVKPAPEAEAGPLLAKLRTAFVPNRVLVVVSEDEAAGEVGKALPLVRGKKALEGRATAYVCEQRVCALPTSDPAVFAEQIARVRRFSEVEGR